MKIEQQPINEGVLRLAVAGELDLATADDLYEAITAAARAPGTAEIVVDLAEVTFCDSSGSGALVRARKAATEFGVIMAVINPHGVVRLPWTSPAFGAYSPTRSVNARCRLLGWPGRLQSPIDFPSGKEPLNP